MPGTNYVSPGEERRGPPELATYALSISRFRPPLKKFRREWHEISCLKEMTSIFRGSVANPFIIESDWSGHRKSPHI